ncbi:MAG: hypothetical protein LQ346_001650 [Caloplaca aetnensis]|nr:MAG: hypothetical protein LQ346_001650 [Caloplaca aetnensis]
MKREISGKKFNLPQYSLQARIQEYAQGAEGTDEVLWSTWKGSNNDIPESDLYSADSGAREKAAEPTAKYEGIQASNFETLGLIRDNLERAVKEARKTWPKDDQNQDRKAYRVVGGHVIGKSKAVATTLSGLGGPTIKTEFGKNANAIWACIGESTMSSELDTWTVIRSANVDILGGVILAGVHQQLKPPVFSATADPRTNEFAPQLQLSPFDRLVSNGFPYVKLTANHRAHPDLTEFPNHHTHGKEMETLHKA